MSTRSCISMILVAAVALVAACGPSHQPVNVDAWRVGTLRLVAASEKGGAYAEPVSGKMAAATPYATYHALKTLQILGVQPTPAHSERTVKWLRSIVKNGRIVSGMPSGDEIGDLFYTLSVLASLHADVPDRRVIANTVHQLQFESGPYAFSEKHKRSVVTRPDVDDALLATYEALQILHLIGESPKRLAQLVSWLQEEWDATLSHPNETATTTLSMLAACLQMVSPTDSRLDSAWRLIQAHMSTQLQQSGESREFLLMDVADAVEAAERLNGHMPLILDDFVAEVQQHQNADGGFNAFLKGDSDYLGIYLATKVLKHTQRIEAHAEGIKTLITTHQLAQGGYATMVSRPHSLDVTHGVALGAHYLRIPLDTSRLAAYLASILQGGANASDIYLALHTAQFARVDVALPDALKVQLVRWTDVHGAPTNRDELDSLYYSVGALRLAAVELPGNRRSEIASDLELMRNEDGGYGPDGTSRLDVTARIAVIFEALQVAPHNRESLVRWIQGRQKAGFGEVDGLEQLPATYLALEALHSLGAQPTKPEELRRWIASCLRAEGGASVAPPGTESDDGTGSGALIWTGIAVRSLELTGIELTDEVLRGLLK